MQKYTFIDSECLQKSSHHNNNKTHTVLYSDKILLHIHSLTHSTHSQCARFFIHLPFVDIPKFNFVAYDSNEISDLQKCFAFVCFFKWCSKMGSQVKYMYTVWWFQVFLFFFSLSAFCHQHSTFDRWNSGNCGNDDILLLFGLYALLSQSLLNTNGFT